MVPQHRQLAICQFGGLLVGQTDCDLPQIDGNDYRRSWLDRDADIFGRARLG